MQGRSLQANDRVFDTREAIGHLERAIKLDPEFAHPYVNLAAAKVFVAEYEVTDDRKERFEQALAEGKELVKRAIELDSENGDAYLQRAALAYYDDLSIAEADYRRGLELSPNAAKGYAGLAAVVFENPARRDEALEILERARKLDPLEPYYDVFKAVFLSYERADIPGAIGLLEGVLREHPRYVAALVRLCEIRGFLTGELAEGIRLCEEALAIDPPFEAPRRALVRLYLDVDELAAAQQLAASSSGETSVPQSLISLFQRDWARAGEAAYDAIERRTAAPNNMGTLLAAIRMHARTTGDTTRAIAAVESIAGVQWDAAGRPTLTGASPLRDAPIALADLMILDGQEARGRRLLEEILARMRHELDVERRPDFWYLS